MLRATQLYDQLHALQHPISEDELVNAILKGLGPTYRPFIQNIKPHLQPIYYEDLFGLLLSEELPLKNEQYSTCDFLLTAHYSSKSFNCNSYGHLAQQYPSPRTDNSRFAPTISNYTSTSNNIQPKRLPNQS